MRAISVPLTSIVMAPMKKVSDMNNSEAIKATKNGAIAAIIFYMVRGGLILTNIICHETENQDQSLI